MASLHLTPNPTNLSHPISENRASLLKISQTQLLKRHENHTTLSTSYFHRILSLCKNSQIQEAVDLVTEMDFRNLHIGPEIYGEILQGCVYERALLTGQQIHARILKNGDFYARNEYIETKLVIFYAKCDVLDVADVLFSKLRAQNVFSWAAIIGLKCRLGLSEEALMGFVEMQENGIFPDNFVVPNACKACGALRWLRFGRGIHGYVVKVGFVDCVFVASSLIDMYGKCGVLDDARKMFDEMPDRNVIAWNAMMVSYVQNGMHEEVINVFYDMREEGVEPTRVTVSSFLSASANLEGIEEGKQCHAVAIVNGLELDNILGSSIINFYCKVGLIEYAEMIFKRMVEKDVVTWNLLISGFVRHGIVENAIYMCQLMRLENLRFDCVTSASLMAAAAHTTNLKLGKEAHCYCIRNNLESDMILASSTVDMYAKCGRIVDARKVFDSTIQRDVILWNTLLAAYAEFGHSGEALRLFYQMQLDSVPPNIVSWNSLILGFVRNGQVNEANELFLQMESLGINPNLITWTTIMSGLVQSGCSDHAIVFFKRMQESGLKPNAFSFSIALSACANLASLLCGRSIHGYIIRHEYFSSVPLATSLVDMYAKCGNINQAEKVFNINSYKELPLYNAMIFAYALHGKAKEAIAVYRGLDKVGIKPDSITFTNVLSACKHAGTVNDAMKIFIDMVSKHRTEPQLEHYGLMVDLFAWSGKLDKAFELVTEMPFEPDARMIGPLLASCREQQKRKLADHLSRHLLELEPDNSGNYVALSNAYATEERWDEVLKVRDLMKGRGLKKKPGCSWIQIGEEVYVFVASDETHPKTDEIQRTLALLRHEMCSDSGTLFS